ncbi:hypothetical protein FRC17_008466, partial [Serendipita sp. 399]
MQTVQDIALDGVAVQVNFDKVDAATLHTTELQQPTVPETPGDQEISIDSIGHLMEGPDDQLGDPAMEEPLKEHVELWCDPGQSEEENMSNINEDNGFDTIEEML